MADVETAFLRGVIMSAMSELERGTHTSVVCLALRDALNETTEEKPIRTFTQQNDRGDMLWLDEGTHRPRYARAEDAKKRRYVPLYVEVFDPVEGKVDD